MGRFDRQLVVDNCPKDPCNVGGDTSMEMHLKLRDTDVLRIINATLKKSFQCS